MSTRSRRPEVGSGCSIKVAPSKARPRKRTGLRLGIAQVSLEFVQDARALGGVFLFGDQPLFEEVGQPSEAGGDGGFRRAR